ncbi:hypothetical protein ACQKLP_10755 [Chitinophaga sp. NPDC101104]|uniref:hypothetical protein n=1 Tax=Chitinophaga sp. NPDC101104 TaxID=3390561 RepID=UPI003D05DC48
MNWNSYIMPEITSSYNPMEPGQTVWQKSARGYTINCKTIHIPSDVPVLVRWKKISWGTVVEPGDLGKALSQHLFDLAMSEDAQPYMLYWEDQPIVQVEIVEEWSCELSVTSHYVKKGDYCFFMHFNPEITLVPVIVAALRSVCDWWIREGVTRIWTTLLPTNLMGTPLLLNAGFDLVERHLPQEESELYTFPMPFTDIRQ